MVSPFFSFNSGDRVIWLAPNTSSVFAEYVGEDRKADGNIYIRIRPLPSMSGGSWVLGEFMEVLGDQVVPAFD